MKRVILSWGSILSVLCTVSCGGPGTPQRERPGMPVIQAAALHNGCLDSLRTGDILLRTGNDGVSDVFRYLNTRNQTYSHAGIAVRENGRLQIYHSIGGADNPTECLRCDPAPVFVQPRHNLGYAVIRYDLDSSSRQRLVLLVKQYYAAHLRFDNDFDLRSDDKMYCTEFVYKVLRQAAADTGYLGTTVTDKARYVAVDDLFNNKHSQTICELRYK